MGNRETGIVSIYLKIAKLVVHNVTNEVREYYLYDHLIIPAKYFLSANRWEGRNDGIHKSTKSWKQSWSRIRGSPLAKVKKYGYVMLTSGPSNFNPGWMDCKITGLRDFGISFVFSFIFWWMFRILWDRGFCCNYWLVLVCYQSSSLVLPVVTEKLFEAPGMRAPPYGEPGCPAPQIGSCGRGWIFYPLVTRVTMTICKIWCQCILGVFPLLLNVLPFFCVNLISKLQK